MVVEIFIKHLVTTGEQYSDSVYEKTKSFLPFLARICLLSTFVQDNCMFAYYWRDVLEVWKHSPILVAMIVICFIIRVFGCAMILLQKRVPIACGLLFVSSILQIFVTSSLNDTNTLLVNAAIFGSLVILLAENQGEADSMFATVPTLNNKKPQDYLKLSGRCLVILMFFNFISFKPSLLLILEDIFACALMVLVVLGYKTKLSVLTTIVYLNVINFTENNWWSIYNDISYTRHQFFQGIAVTGGLLMIVLHGPGEISMDKAKKLW